MIHTFPPLLNLLGGENLGIEYKEDLDTKNKQGPYADDALAESLMAMSNAGGGYLLLGVNNKAVVTGINPGRQDRPNALLARIVRKFMRAPSLAAHEYEIDSKRVFCLYIEATQPPPHQLQNGVFKIRKDLVRK